MSDDLPGEELGAEGAPTGETAVAVVASVAPTLVATQPLMTDDEIRKLWRIAKPLAESRMFKNVTQAEQAFAKMIIGRDLGLSPAQAMQGLHLVEGGIMVAYPMLGQFVRARAGYDFRLVEHTNEKCAIEFLRDGESLGVSEFTIEDAKTAKLIKDGGNWTKYPKNMLFARAMSNGVKWIVPEVLAGLPVYVEGEIEPERMVDGGRELPEGATRTDDDAGRIVALVNSLPVKLEIRQRLAVAITESDRLAPGSFPIGKAEMLLLGLSPEAVLRECLRIEAANDALRREEPPDAEVVEPAVAEGEDVGDAIDATEGTEAGIEALTDEELGSWVDRIQSWLEEGDVTDERRNELLGKLDLAEAEIDQRRAEAIVDEGAVEPV